MYLNAEKVNLGILTKGIEWWGFLPETDDSDNLVKFESLNILKSSKKESITIFEELMSKSDLISKNFNIK